MSDDSKLSVPPFECRLPPELLKDLDDRGRYLYEAADKQGQRQEWMMAHLIVQAETLAGVKRDVIETRDLALKTNGRVTALEKRVEEIQPTIEAVKTVGKAIKNKYVLIAAAAFLLLGLPAIVRNAPSFDQFASWAKTALGG